MLQHLVRDWHKHLDENKMNWLQHFRFAGGQAMSCLYSAILLLIHATLPFFFPTAGEVLTEKLYRVFTVTKKNELNSTASLEKMFKEIELTNR